MNDFKIGIVGGFGAYATSAFMEKIYKAFMKDSERDIPHMICDNNFRMPSRTRCLLTGEGYTQIVNDIAGSITMMINNNVDVIVLPCGTAHYFLDDVFELVPDARKLVLNIIDCVGEYLSSINVDRVLSIAAEGTLYKHIYNKYMSKYSIDCIEPGEEYFQEIRFFIECVKRNDFADVDLICSRFLDFISSFDADDIILGCTEFPVLVDKLIQNGKLSDIFDKGVRMYDPLDCVVSKLLCDWS